MTQRFEEKLYLIIHTLLTLARFQYNSILLPLFLSYSLKLQLYELSNNDVIIDIDMD